MNSTTGDGDRRAELLGLPPDRNLAVLICDETLSFRVIVVFLRNCTLSR